MARRVINRRELRVSDALMRDLKELEESEKKQKRAMARTSTPATPSPRKTVKQVRLKAYWAVINSAGQEVAEFDYAAQAHAQQKAAELTESKKSHHFVRMAKKALEE